jgi:hypothetical protein
MDAITLELAAETHPAAANLARALSFYRATQLDLEQQQSKLAKNEKDLDKALYGEDDDEAQRLQIAVTVSRRKIENRTAQVQTCFKELEQAIVSAGNALNSLVTGKWIIQKDELMDAVLNILEPSDGFDRQKLEDLIESDVRVEAIHALSVQNYSRHMIERFTQNPVSKITTADGVQDIMDDRHIVANHTTDIEYTISSAEAILKNFSMIETL